jgi:ankyrin repeat protein
MKTSFAAFLFSISILIVAGCHRGGGTISEGRFSYNATDVFGDGTSQLALAEAAGRGDVESINRLIAAGANVNYAGKHEITPLWWAAWARNVNGFEALLVRGANPNTQRAEGLPVMCLIADMDDSRYLKAALAHGGNPNLQDAKSGETPLFPAVKHSRNEQIDLLLAAKADVNVQLPIMGWTATMFAMAARADYHVIYQLLQAGSDPTLKASDGRTLADIIDVRSINASNNNDPWRVKVLEFLRNKRIAVNQSP